MKVIIPAKSTSSRVPAKNWRPFYDGKNLVEIKIEQLVKCINPQDVYLSCDSKNMKHYADKAGINFIHRAAALASDQTTWPDALFGMIREMPVDDEEDIVWVEVVNPLFDDFASMFRKWEEVKKDHDSIVLAAPVTKFLLHGNGVPVNFLPGKWHAMSQSLEPLYAWDSASIMKKRDILYFSYPFGKKPYLFVTEEQCIDIDTMDEFELAQILFSKKNKR